MTSNFLIVTFVDENDAPGIVASNWVVNNSTCYYPNVRTEEMKNKLLKRMADPDESTWPQYEIRILKSYGKLILFTKSFPLLYLRILFGYN